MLFSIYLLVQLENRMGFIMSSANVPTDVSDALLDQLGRAQMQVAAVSLALLVISVFLGVKLSHRIYGPIVQIRNHVVNLINGEFKSRVHLRDNDHFIALGDDLNQLADILEKQKTSV